jgi:hypothetical protein
MTQRLSNGLGVYFQQDIENVLRGVDAASLDIANIVPTPQMEIYRRGHAAAINAMSAAFGLNYRSEPEQPETLAAERHPFITLR